jgi:hypothetical protein
MADKPIARISHLESPCVNVGQSYEFKKKDKCKFSFAKIYFACLMSAWKSLKSLKAD